MLRLPRNLRFSLGELLLVALAAALGLGALRAGDLFAAGYLLGAAALVAALLVAAIVARDVERAFAVGFLVSAAVYGGVLYWYGDEEFDPERGRLLTTRAADPVYRSVREIYYVDAFLGREATAEEAAAAARRRLLPMTYWNASMVSVPFGEGIRVAKVGNTYWNPDVRPGRREFMQIVHLLVALTFGYAGGKFGAALYRRRDRTSLTVASDGVGEQT